MVSYYVRFRILDMLKQEIIVNQTEFFDDSAEACMSFLEKSGKCAGDGYKLEFADADENGYMEEHYTDDRYLIMIELEV